MSIKIGDNNKIKKSNIIDSSNSTVKSEDISKDIFANRHPILIGIGCSIVASVIMMFGFWDKISEFIKKLILGGDRLARSKIIKNFISASMDIDIALQNLMAIIYCLEDEALINWVKKELAGYGENDELPQYRKLKGIVRASFMVGYAQYSKRQFGIAHLDEEMQENLLNTHIYSSISTLIEMKDKDACLGKPIPPEFYGKLQATTNAHITDASVDIDIAMVSDIISNVKTKILETLLFLEKEFGNLDELDIDISIKNEEELKSIIQHIQVNLYDNSINIGDNNKIKSSSIMTNK